MARRAKNKKIHKKNMRMFKRFGNRKTKVYDKIITNKLKKN